MKTPFWWIRQVLAALFSGFFIYFGIHVLWAAYRLENPFMFVMTFFASNFIILISIVMFMAFVYRMVRKEQNTDEEDYENENDL
ncbi:hypothetical protein ACFL5W_01840 [Thermodesulfobacteriota bacterium]|jgi:membrane protein implicated in regulation of membrane protease activity